MKHIDQPPCEYDKPEFLSAYTSLHMQRQRLLANSVLYQQSVSGEGRGFLVSDYAFTLTTSMGNECEAVSFGYGRDDGTCSSLSGNSVMASTVNLNRTIVEPSWINLISCYAMLINDFADLL